MTMTDAPPIAPSRKMNGPPPPIEGEIVPALAPSPSSILAIIDKAAANPNTNVETMERLLGIYERVEAGQAQQDFADALVAAQRDMPAVIRKGVNTHTHSKYALLEDISDQIDPVINQHGFALSYGTADSPLPSHYRVICKVMRGRHTETYHADVPADIAGAKGTANKNPTQGFGSTMSYGRRYLKVLIFDVKIVGEDDDGQAIPHDDRRINASEVKWLRQTIADTGTDLARFLKDYMKVEKLEDLTVEQMERARYGLRQKQIANSQAKAKAAPAAATAEPSRPAASKPRAVK